MTAPLLFLVVAAQMFGPSLPTPVSPLPGAMIEQNTEGCPGFMIRFEWSVPEPLAIFEYQIKILGPGTREYAVDRLVAGRSFIWNNCQSGVTNQSADGWTWRVRARDRSRQWSFWTPPLSFHFSRGAK